MTVLDAPLFPSTTTELLRAAMSGDRDAWERLINRFEPAVVAAINTYRLQDADARDAAQCTWLQMLEHGGQIREPEALGRWLQTTAKRECLRILRDGRRVATLLDAEWSERPDATVDVERSVVETEMTHRIRDAVKMLPARSISLIRTLFQDDPPAYAEIAHRTGIPVGSIGPTRVRTLRKLRRLIDVDSGDWS
jgi:RNA polymerase sigma factor (sigma-70 family)